MFLFTAVPIWKINDVINLGIEDVGWGGVAILAGLARKDLSGKMTDK